jgi:hypothetical protein
MRPSSVSTIVWVPPHDACTTRCPSRPVTCVALSLLLAEPSPRPRRPYSPLPNMYTSATNQAAILPRVVGPTTVKRKAQTPIFAPPKYVHLCNKSGCHLTPCGRAHDCQAKGRRFKSRLRINFNRHSTNLQLCALWGGMPRRSKTWGGTLGRSHK